MIDPLCADRTGLGPHDVVYNGEENWFLNILLHDGRTIELYMQVSDFPLDPEYVHKGTSSCSFDMDA